jgi:hypothetical protein
MFRKQLYLLPVGVLFLLSFQAKLVAQNITIPLVVPPTACSNANGELTCGWSNGSCSQKLSGTFDNTVYSCSLDASRVPVYSSYTKLGCFPNNCRIVTKTFHCNNTFTMNPSCTGAANSADYFNFTYSTTTSAPTCGCSC